VRVTDGQTPAQKALAACRQAIADVGTRTLSGPEHASLKRELDAARQPLWFVTNGFWRSGQVGVVVQAKDGAAAIVRAREGKLFGPNDGTDEHLKVSPFSLETVIDIA
jgi:hypothetical protein